MMNTKNRRTRIVFQLLGFYVLFQFFWWAIHIIQLHGEIYELQNQLNYSTLSSSEAYDLYTKKVWMVAGEGAVFMLLLVIGMWQIARAMRRESKLARQERNFTLSVTHELKTPVATLRLFLETMQTRELSPDQKTKILAEAVNETHRLDHLVENILLSKRLEQKADAQKGVVNLSNIVKERTSKLQAVLCTDHPLMVEAEADCVITGDQLELESLLTNLVDNARKYTPEGTPIEVKLYRRQQKIILRVIDQGPGIPEEERLNVFKKFYRIGNEETRNSKGTGLGLYIVSRIAFQHGGTVWILEREGGGAIFEISLPAIDQQQHD